MVTFSIYKVSLIAVGLLYCLKPHGDRNNVLTGNLNVWEMSGGKKYRGGECEEMAVWN